MTLQELIDRLIQIRDGHDRHLPISPNAPVILIEDALPGQLKHKGIEIRISEPEEISDGYKYIVSGDDGGREHGDIPTEQDHEVHIYWEPIT